MDSKNAGTLLAQFHSLVDVNKTSLHIALLAIAFNPTAWNIVARNGTCYLFFLVHCALILIYVLNITEYRNKTITRIFGGNARYGCYFLAVMIFICGILRDQLYVYFTIDFPALLIMEHSYHLALFDQPQTALLPEKYRIIVSAALFITGQIFVVTSTWALGITGTFLGDYFGILMDHRVEGWVQLLFFLGKVLILAILNSLGSLSMSYGIQCTWVVPCVLLPQLSGKHLFTS